jgi:hypothetical protein
MRKVRAQICEVVAAAATAESIHSRCLQSESTDEKGLYTRKAKHATLRSMMYSFSTKASRLRLPYLAHQRGISMTHSLHLGLYETDGMGDKHCTSVFETENCSERVIMLHGGRIEGLFFQE